MNESDLTIFFAAFAVSAFAGVAALLRTGGKLTPFTVISAAMNSGMMGLGVCLLWYTQFQTNVYGLVGMCLLLGLGGQPTVDFVVETIRHVFLKRESKDG